MKKTNAPSSNRAYAAQIGRKHKILEKEIIKEKNKNKLLNNRIRKFEDQSSNKHSHTKNHKIEEYYNKELDRRVRVARELMDVAKIKHPGLRRFSPLIIMISLGLYLLHGPSLEYMRNFLALPSRQAILKRLKINLKFDYKLLTDVL